MRASTLSYQSNPAMTGKLADQLLATTPGVPAFGAGQIKLWIFCEIGLIRLGGMTLPGSGCFVKGFTSCADMLLRLPDFHAGSGTLSTTFWADASREPS